ncbi:hypothetical protein B0H13DRAFT_2385914, partial [Mycena leptocephala]
NLSWNTTDDILREAFAAFGEVTDCIAMKDRDTGRMRGFGFVTFGSQDQASAPSARCTTRSWTAGASVSTSLARSPAEGGGGYNSGGYGGGGGGGGGGYSSGGYEQNNSSGGTASGKSASRSLFCVPQVLDPWLL